MRTRASVITGVARSGSYKNFPPPVLSTLVKLQPRGSREFSLSLTLPGNRRVIVSRDSSANGSSIYSIFSPSPSPSFAFPRFAFSSPPSLPVSSPLHAYRIRERSLGNFQQVRGHAAQYLIWLFLHFFLGDFPHSCC